ncbi:MAG: Lcl domain-containing protein [Wenzhouxiangella sp.]
MVIASNFWSASPYAGNTDNAWNVNFKNGNDNWNNKSNNNRVRLVRGG